MARSVGQRTAPTWKPRVSHPRGGVWNPGAGVRWSRCQDAAASAKSEPGQWRRPKGLANRISKGSKLFREWHGETHEVLVLDKGFAWRGETYSSLGAIARAITGAHWNGWAFFGVKRRPKEPPDNG
jgi:DUF2924 family protein